MAKARYQSFLQSQLISIEDFYRIEEEKKIDPIQEEEENSNIV